MSEKQSVKSSEFSYGSSTSKGQKPIIVKSDTTSIVGNLSSVPDVKGSIKPSVCKESGLTQKQLDQLSKSTSNKQSDSSQASSRGSKKSYKSNKSNKSYSKPPTRANQQRDENEQIKKLVANSEKEQQKLEKIQPVRLRSQVNQEQQKIYPVRLQSQVNQEQHKLEQIQREKVRQQINQYCNCYAQQTIGHSFNGQTVQKLCKQVPQLGTLVDAGVSIICAIKEILFHPLTLAVLNIISFFLLG